jgi:enamine deaminase RidA (YjgF/YER057c/UK114 family)
MSSIHSILFKENAMTITRAPGNPGRSKYVEFNGVVQLVSTAADRSVDLKGQTTQALATIDALLTEAGSDKSRLLHATVYITDMTRKDDMQEAWMEWVDPDARPLRACIEVGLAGDCLVEIVATAAK